MSLAENLVFRVQGAGFRESGFGFEKYCRWLRVQVSECRVQGSGTRVWGSKKTRGLKNMPLVATFRAGVTCSENNKAEGPSKICNESKEEKKKVKTILYFILRDAWVCSRESHPFIDIVEFHYLYREKKQNSYKLKLLDDTSGNETRFRGGLAFKAHRLLYHSTLGLRVIKKKKMKLEEKLNIETQPVPELHRETSLLLLLLP